MNKEQVLELTKSFNDRAEIIQKELVREVESLELEKTVVEAQAGVKLDELNEEVTKAFTSVVDTASGNMLAVIGDIIGYPTKFEGASLKELGIEAVPAVLLKDENENVLYVGEGMKYFAIEVTEGLPVLSFKELTSIPEYSFEKHEELDAYAKYTQLMAVYASNTVKKFEKALKPADADIDKEA